MSWYNNILTNASTNITKLQRTYFAGDADGDTEDDTHVCRVLRSYYTEKGQAFPGWLPPDPKAPPPVQPVYAAQQNQVGSRYGGFNNTQQGGGAAPAPGAGRLQSLWDNNNSSQQPAQPASLRQGRANPFAARGGREEAAPSRPLPSQRGGSYQQTGSYGRSETTPPPGSTSTGGSAQEKLKQRLWGGSKTTSPSNSAGGGPFQPPSQPQQPQAGSRWGGSGSGSGGGNYEDRFAPPGAYDRGGNDKPVMSANAPWAGGDMDYYSGGPDPSAGSGSGGGGGSSGRNRPVGLPSGPRRGGLPSGPRMR